MEGDVNFSHSESGFSSFSGGMDPTMNDDGPFPHFLDGLVDLSRADEVITRPALPPSNPFQFRIDPRYDSQLNRFAQQQFPPRVILTPRPSKPLPDLSFTRRSHGPLPISASADPEFLKRAQDASVTLNPAKLGFIPESVWSEKEEVKFGDLVTSCFHRKNHASCRFSHKLYNALKITEAMQDWFNIIGVIWIGQIVIRVDKRIFAQLLGINAVDGSLFHRQGNFAALGFMELSIAQAEESLEPADLEGVDFDRIRLLVHGPKIFKRDVRPEAIENCRRI